MSVVDISDYLDGRRKNVLIVDDSKALRRTLAKFLQNAGLFVFEAENGAEGIEILKQNEISTVICDWEMPVMNGIEFCRETRNIFGSDEHFILMLTANTQKSAIKELFDAGGNDYLTKPVDLIALSARLLGGLRIATWRDDLKWLNAELAGRKKELDEAYARIKEDLIIAASVQRRHVPKEYRPIDGVEFAGAFEPAFYTGGDIFNYVKLNDNEIGIFSVDVSGHGVASSLLAVTVAEAFCTNGIPQDMLFDTNHPDRPTRPPHHVVSDLNRRFLDNDTDHYFTLTYGVVDKENNEFRFCQAGHPPLLLMHADGHGDTVGTGGLPVGMFDFSDYETSTHHLRQGDRVYLFSDGIPEAENNEGEQFGENGMMADLAISNSMPLPDTISLLVNAARSWQDKISFNDDISIIGFEIPIHQQTGEHHVD